MIPLETDKRKAKNVAEARTWILEKYKGSTRHNIRPTSGQSRILSTAAHAEIKRANLDAVNMNDYDRRTTGSNSHGTKFSAITKHTNLPKN